MKKSRLRRSLIALTAFAAVAVAGLPASAHHSASMFDRDRARVLEGTVREFQWTNPHAWLQVEVVDAAGAPVEWSIEMGGINSLARNGYRPTTFKPGDAVAVQIAPLEDGGPAGLFIGARLADGTVLGQMP
jgi:Family of unknown function (DUF6152)